MLAKRIEEDLKTALKAGDTIKTSTLRLLRSAIGNFLIEKRKQAADDPEIQALIQKQIKLRDDAIACYQQAGRTELLDKETREKYILRTYLPAPLSASELETLVKQVIRELSASGKNDLGKVMKQTLAKVGGRAEGKRIQECALRFLGV